MAKNQYSKMQKKAYYSGMGYSVAYHGKGINYNNAQNKASFHEGWKKGKSLMAKYPNKYTDLKKRGK